MLCAMGQIWKPIAAGLNWQIGFTWDLSAGKLNFDDEKIDAREEM